MQIYRNMLKLAYDVLYNTITIQKWLTVIWLLYWLDRGESLDNLDMMTNRPSWRSSWTPGTTSSIPDYSRPYSSLTDSSIQSGRPGAATVPSYQSLSSHRPSLPKSTSSTRTNPENQPSSQSRYFVKVLGLEMFWNIVRSNPRAARGLLLGCWATPLKLYIF